MKDYKYFKASELVCRCGECDGWMDDNFMEKLQGMRKEADFGFRLSSAYRCPSHNTKVSSTGVSGPHTTGKAVDILCYGSRASKVLALAYTVGMTGIGVSQKGGHAKRFIHVDNIHADNRPWIWSY